MKILGYDLSLKKSNKTEVFAKTQNNTPVRRNPAIVQIVQNFKANSRKDIDQWRKALAFAQHPEEPKLNLYYDLLDDLLTDGHLQSQIQMRKMSTLNTDFQIINRKTGDIEEETTFLFQQQWFYEFLSHSIDCILFGTTLVQFCEFSKENVKINAIPRRNVIPALGKVLPDVTKDDFILYQSDVFASWILQLQENQPLGILNNIIPNLIWKRNVMQSWAEFCEKFGMPLITATTNTTDTDKVNSVNEMLLNLGEASVGTFPLGTEIKFQEANRTDAYNVYMQFMQTNDDQISKQLVGSTMLSDQGSNRSQTEVHERTLDYKIAQADKRFIQFIVNDQLIPLLRLHNYSISEDAVFEFKTAEQEVSLTELWNITSGLLMSGHKVEADWISKTFNIPIESGKL